MEDALIWVEKSVEDRDPKLHFLDVDPEWKDVHDDPCFQGYLKRTGFRI